MKDFQFELAKINEAPLGSYPRLRWFFLISVLVMLLYTTYRLQIPHSTAFVWTIFIALVISNLFIRYLLSPGTLLPAHAGVLLLIDTLALTAFLSQTGASYNPFTILYLLPLVISAALLSLTWTAIISLTSIIGFGSLFLVPQELYGAHVHHSHQLHMLHIEGMWVAFIISVVVISYYLFAIAKERAISAVKIADSNLLRLHQEKLASLTTLSAGAAHELSTPLATVTLTIGELLNSQAISEEIRADLQLAQTELGRCKQILQGMGLTTNGLDSDDSERISIDRLPTELMASLPPESRAMVSIEKAGDSDTAMVPRGVVSQVLPLLVRNALDAGARSVKITPYFQKGQLSVTVADDGNGMTIETLQRAMEPFFTTKQPGAGLGLGLFLCQLMIKRFNGELRLNSTLDSGTTAYVILPGG